MNVEIKGSEDCAADMQEPSFWLITKLFQAYDLLLYSSLNINLQPMVQFEPFKWQL